MEIKVERSGPSLSSSKAKTEFTSVVISQLEWWICYRISQQVSWSWIRGHILKTAPYSSAAAIFSLLCLAPAHTTNTNTNRPTPVAGLKELPLISAELYIFLIRKWNTTLSHSLKSTKANYPSFAQVPMGQESPIYLDPDVSMSQSGR